MLYYIQGPNDFNKYADNIIQCACECFYNTFVVNILTQRNVARSTKKKNFYSR